MSLASFPRSGNSLTRSLFEEITCTATGSAMNPYEADLSLLCKGFQADRIVDSSVFCCKCHFPCKGDWYRDMQTNRVLFIIRDPIKNHQSYFTLLLTSSHCKNIGNDIAKELS